LQPSSNVPIKPLREKATRVTTTRVALFITIQFFSSKRHKRSSPPHLLKLRLLNMSSLFRTNRIDIKVPFFLRQILFCLKWPVPQMQVMIKNKYCDINHNSLSLLMLSLLMKLDNKHLKVANFSHYYLYY
jgi:hypothetical protein